MYATHLTSQSTTQPAAKMSRPVNALQLDLWKGDTTLLTQPVTKGKVPQIRTHSKDFQVVIGGSAALGFLMLQIVKTPDDKDVVMRALASACAIILERPTVNFTGSATKPVPLTGLDILLDESAKADQVITTNFIDASPITKGELEDLLDADVDEIGAFIGLMFIAGNKKLTPQNRTAFNERRAGAAGAGVIGATKIFVPDSVYITDEVIQKMYACFNSRAVQRSHITMNVIDNLDDAYEGMGQAFSSQFHLLVDSGMGGLRIIREVLGMYEWTRTAFPELRPAMNAANAAFKLIQTAPAATRPFLKAIHGNNFVPVAYSQIEGLVGVCREIATYQSSTVANYGGGSITDTQQRIIADHMRAEGYENKAGDDESEAE